MGSENLVTHLWSKSLTEGPHVSANALRVGLVEESVEQTWSDPWLEDHPATNVGADHGFLVSGLLGEGSGGKSCNSEGLHLWIF